MKKALLIVLALSVFSGCSEATSPHTLNSGPTPIPQPQKKPENPTPPVKTPAAPMDADNAFILVGYQDAFVQGERIESLGIDRAPNAKGVAGYVATSVATMDGNEPDGLTLSVPIPLEVKTASEDSIEVYYSCEGSEEASGFRVQAALSSVGFYASGEYPRAEIKTEGLRLMFATCAPAKVTVRVVFLNEQAGGESAWELLSLERGQATQQ